MLIVMMMFGPGSRNLGYERRKFGTGGGRCDDTDWFHGEATLDGQDTFFCWGAGKNVKLDLAFVFVVGLVSRREFGSSGTGSLVIDLLSQSSILGHSDLTRDVCRPALPLHITSILLVVVSVEAKDALVLVHVVAFCTRFG